MSQLAHLMPNDAIAPTSGEIRARLNSCPQIEGWEAGKHGFWVAYPGSTRPSFYRGNLVDFALSVGAITYDEKIAIHRSK
jgi:hypothetical protein